MVESHQRSIAKGLTWRAIATTITMGLIYWATGNLVVSASLGAVDVVVKLVAYYGHERVWNAVSWGRDLSTLG